MHAARIFCRIIQVIDSPGMALLNVDQIAQRALDLGLLEDRQLQEVWASFGRRNVSLNDFLQTLVRRAYLTNYQVERLIRGDRTGFFYGDYKALYLVGSGTFARVFRAVQQKTGQVVALKVLRSRYSEHVAQANQFLQEGRVGCTLSHPNIVPVYEVISDGKNCFMAMEFIEGRNLREFVRIRKKVEPAEATRLMIGIADGMRYAFEHGLTHRDLKMSNILVSSRGEAKLVDFGLAGMDDTLKEDIRADLPNVRTIDYAALERATGVRKGDTRSDLYFLGCIYYNMLSGKPPLIETRDRTWRLSKQRFVNIVPIQKLEPSLPLAVTLVVNKAMMFDPSRRYQSPSAMLADLRQAAKHLAAGTDVPGAAGLEAQAANLAAAAAPVEEPDRWVMVVESDVPMQDLFRDGFKRAGYRVLMTSDPWHAASRIEQNPAAADCMIVSAQFLGETALQMFNQLAENEKNKQLPAILLLDASQRDWASQAVTAPHRLVLPLPLSMKRLLAAVDRLLSATPQAGPRRIAREVVVRASGPRLTPPPATL